MITFTLLTTIGKAAHRSSDDELELMKRIKARDTDALEELYDLYKRVLFGIVISIVKKREEAENLLQEIFVLIWNKAELFNSDSGNVYSWIVTLARNKAIHHIRSTRNKMQQDQTGSIHDSLLSPGEVYYDPMGTTIFSDRAELVKRALNEIPEKQSEIVKIAYYRGLTQSEISNYLSIPLETVEKRMRQGMEKLKRTLGEFISTDG